MTIAISPTSPTSIQQCNKTLDLTKSNTEVSSNAGFVPKTSSPCQKQTKMDNLNISLSPIPVMNSSERPIISPTNFESNNPLSEKVSEKED